MLTKEELLSIEGGSWKLFAGIAIGLGTLISGIIDGIFRPLACRK